MSLDLSSALRDVAEHAPLGTLEPTGLGRRIRRRRAGRTAARSAVGLGLAGAIAVVATQAPGVLRREGPAAPPPPVGLPADQVATVLPTADAAAAPGECGWTVRRPSTPFGSELGVAFEQYSAETHGPVAVSVESWPGEASRPLEPVRVVAARDGVVVAAADPVFFEEHALGWAGADLSTVACGGPDALKALPDGTYTVYAVVTDPVTGDVVALSPGEPLVVAGNAREVWCHADQSVMGTNDPRVALTGGVVSDPGELSVELEAVWSGSATAQVMDQRVILVDDATGRIALDTMAREMVRERSISSLVPGAAHVLSLRSDRTSCDGGALPAGTYTGYAVVTIATAGADTGVGLPTNATAVAELRRGVVVP
ncbi:hypothetical protein [Cellulomonas sp. Leaf334]|uniref:hypothetical protein n=1 Tax=Cellulomonas sp. Leaf334 TaxID=1736339 RepID=UPI0006F29B10|nr:hypothetical protein [Cellulomonas sp. Leaf334]KQR17110.1 hypothetical protein ASF78_07295 [Cellulomonas sp. Leaf334]